jgi:hypothetical protein
LTKVLFQVQGCKTGTPSVIGPATVLTNQRRVFPLSISQKDGPGRGRMIRIRGFYGDVIFRVVERRKEKAAGEDPGIDGMTISGVELRTREEIILLTRTSFSPGGYFMFASHLFLILFE